MRITSFVKTLNNTELGKGGTHDSYILVPSADADVGRLFDEMNTPTVFVDRTTNKECVVRIIKYQNGEVRIPGLGPYFREKDLHAGDDVILERIDTQEVKRYISVRKHDNIIVLQKGSWGFKVLNDNRIRLLTNDVLIEGKTVELQYIVSKPLRSDSPEMTDYYDLFIDGKKITNNYKHNELLEIVIDGEKSEMITPCNWRKYYINTEV